MNQETPQLDRQTILVVPCYNEADRLSVGVFRLYLQEQRESGFVFVDDGSSDETFQTCLSVREGFEDSVVVLRSPQNQGKAEAVRFGMRYALEQSNAVFIGFWDADLATPLGAIPEFGEILRKKPHIEMVFGARVQLLGRDIQRKTLRHYLGRVFATVVSVVLRLPVYDTQCGAKIFRVSEDLKVILATPFLTKWIFDVEILARFLALRRGRVPAPERSIYEHPLQEWRDVGGSKVRAKDFVVAFKDLIRIHFASFPRNK